MRLRAILYDFDGTLADSTELIMRCYRHTMQTHLGEIPSEEEWLTGFGTPLEGQIERYARSREEWSAMMDTYRSHQREHHDALLRPFPGVVETVAAIAAKGVRLAIVTSKHREATLRGMELCGLLDHFPVIITPEDVHRAKPDPEPVLRALDGLEVDAGEALFIGDSPHDIVSGRAAGTRTAAAMWGPFPRPRLEEESPDYYLETPQEVLRLLAGVE